MYLLLTLISFCFTIPVYAELSERSTWASVSNGQPNTLSPWGTSSARRLPYWLTNNPLPHGRPWGNRNSWNTNYYYDCPNNGVTRHYDWNITRESCAPDGVASTCLLVNGQFPGPLIEANWGDWIEVTVHNKIPDEGTSIHWHGLLQKYSPYMDGVPGFTQCPIAPGSTFTYRFRADLYGTTWYHAHYSSQYGSGLMGPMVIYGPRNVKYDIDLGPVMISDYYHDYWTTITDALFKPLPAVNIPMSDNNLINGKNNFNCATTSRTCSPNAPRAVFRFQSGKTYRIRLINPSSAATEKFTIDGHNFTVIANDFVEIEPYETDHITLAVGQRSDILVKATGKPTDAYWMRAYKPPPCWPTRGGDEAKAAVFYEHADTTKDPTTSPGPNAYNQYCGNDLLSQTVPSYAIAPGEPAVTEVLPLEFRPNMTGNLLWYMANRTFRANYNDPILLEAKLGNFNFDPIRNLHNYGSNHSLRFIVENTGVQPHPMHMHGHNMYILAEGACTSNSSVFGNPQGVSQPGQTNTTIAQKRAAGEYGNCWDGTITNPHNPQRRDVHMLLAGSYIVVQWDQDNPGAWPFHCHIAWHLSAGFVWSIIEQPGGIRREMEIPAVMAQTCRDWAAWSGTHVVNQIDDGL